MVDFDGFCRSYLTEGNGSSFGMLINSRGPGCGWERWFRNSAGFLFGYIQCKSSSLGPYILKKDGALSF